MEFILRLFSPPTGHFFLIGARGTGKTSWCARQYPQALRIDLLDSETFGQFAAHPERLIKLAEAHPEKKCILIEEIQKVPELLHVVHLLIQRRSTQQFILTTSNVSQLRRTRLTFPTDDIPRRFLYPYMANELGERFRLENALRYGMLPAVWADNDPIAAVHACNSRYVREEIKNDRLVPDIGDYFRFLEAISLAQASVLDLSCVSHECKLDRKAVERYIDILEDLLLGFRVPALIKRTSRNPIPPPKFYFSDVGIFRANLPRGLLDTSDDSDWAALEGLVAQHLRAWCDYSAGRHHLYYWRTRGQLEVSFVVYGESRLYAIDVRNFRSIRAEDFRALKSFGEEHPASRRYLLHRGEERFESDGILCLPCEKFLLALQKDWLPG